MAKPSIATATAAFNGTGIKEQFNSGLLYVFAGPIPATADESLDMSNKHTVVLKVSKDGSGAGLSFSDAAAGVLSKVPSDVWSGTVTLEGYQSAESSITPTFYRFCAAGDDGQGAANTSTGYRIQGTAGGPNSGAELQFGTAVLTPGAAQPVGAFTWSFER